MNSYSKKNRKLVEAWNKADSVVIKRRIELSIVELNTPFICKAIGGRAYDKQDSDDLFNECAKSVIDALENYDQTMGKSEFLSYWVWHIKKAISSYYYWKNKYAVEIVDSTIMGKNHQADGTYGILEDQPVYDEEYEISIDDILRSGVLYDKEIDVLKKFYGLEMNLAQIGQTLGVSGSRVQQMINPALIKLHKYYKNRESKYIKFPLSWRRERTVRNSTRRKSQSTQNRPVGKSMSL